MIFPSDFRLQPFSGFGWVMAMVWLGSSGMGWAQSSLNTVVAPPVFPPPIEEPWPVAGLGLGPRGPETLPAGGWRGGQPSLLSPGAPEGFSLQFGTEHVGIRFQAPESATLGPGVDLTVPSQPLPEAGKAKAGTKGAEAEPGAWQLGNVSFNRTAQSFNVSKAEGAVRKDDLSDQFGKVGGTRNVVTATPITGWAIAGVGMLVVLIAMAVAHYESDDDDRKRRKKARHRRRHHSS